VTTTTWKGPMGGGLERAISRNRGRGQALRRGTKGKRPEEENFQAETIPGGGHTFEVSLGKNIFLKKRSIQWHHGKVLKEKL